jgi:hypothetical protein
MKKSFISFQDIRKHMEHKLICCAVGKINDPQAVVIKCTTCGEILVECERELCGVQLGNG